MKTINWHLLSVVTYLLLGISLSVLVVLHLIAQLKFLGWGAFQIPTVETMFNNFETPNGKLLLYTEQLSALIVLFTAMIAITLSLIKHLPSNTKNSANTSDAHGTASSPLQAALRPHAPVLTKISWFAFAVFSLTGPFVSGWSAWVFVEDTQNYYLTLSLGDLYSILPLFGLIWFTISVWALYRLFSAPKGE